MGESHTQRDRRWQHRLLLGVPAVVFLLWHVPLMYRTAAGQDEAWYAGAGSAILRTGIPHVPYITSDDPTSLCYHADVALYTLPPLSFYLQALVHLVLGVGLGPARMVAVLAGMGAAYLVYELGTLWFGDQRGALLASAAYMFSRPFLFPATTARPDMVATALGLLALWLFALAVRSPRQRGFLLASGLAAGSSILSHPFGIVVVIQAGLFLLARRERRRRRILECSIFALAAVGVVSLWLPLIALYPDLFRSQFGGNVLGRAVPGMARNTFSPLGLVGFHCWQVWKFVTPVQCMLFLVGLAWAAARARTYAGGREFCYHLGASGVLLVLFMGRHYTHGYYSYPAAFASLAVGMAGSEAGAWLKSRLRTTQAWPTWLVAALIFAALVPGAGLRTLAAHVRHWNDPNYDAHRVALAALEDIPEGALTAVDGGYVLDFHLAGRRVVDAFIDPDNQIHIYDIRLMNFQYIVFGAHGLKATKPRMRDLTFLKAYGNPRDPFASYLELYKNDAWRPPGRAHGSNTQSRGWRFLRDSCRALLSAVYPRAARRREWLGG